MHQFLSSIANGRTDAHGGALVNRLCYPLEVFDAVRQAWPDKPLDIRVSATDWMEGGWDLAQTVDLARHVQVLGCDWMDVSGGGISLAQKITVEPGYQVPFARAVRKTTGLPTSAVGLITNAQQAERRCGPVGLVSLARTMLWHPHWSWQTAVELHADVVAPPQHWRSARGAHRRSFATAATVRAAAQ